MDKKKISTAMISLIVASLAVATMTASSSLYNTPLYTFRMEQVSNEMNFLPTEMNDLTYTAENGYNLNYGVAECLWNCDTAGNDTTPLIMTWQYTCEFYHTCSYECPETNQWTCWVTC